jgi:hypothetical protein
VGTLLAATAAANPGIGPNWLIPGVRPPKREGVIVLEDSSRTRGEIDMDAVCLGPSSKFALTLLLLAEDFEFEVDVVATLCWDIALDLICAGDVATFLIGGRYCADEDDGMDVLLGVAAADLRSATLLVGATPHFPRTQPPTEPMRPFVCVVLFV